MKNSTNTKENAMINDKDFISLSKITINELTRDNMIQEFMSSTDSERTEIAEAYVMAAVKRFDKFATKMNTNPEFAKFITLKVLGSLS